MNPRFVVWAKLPNGWINTHESAYTFAYALALASEIKARTKLETEVREA